MTSDLTERLTEVVDELLAEDANAVLAFAEYLSQRRKGRLNGLNGSLSDEEHERVVTMLNEVSILCPARFRPHRRR